MRCLFCGADPRKLCPLSPFGSPCMPGVTTAQLDWGNEPSSPPIAESWRAATRTHILAARQSGNPWRGYPWRLRTWRPLKGSLSKRFPNLARPLAQALLGAEPIKPRPIVGPLRFKPILGGL